MSIIELKRLSSVCCQAIFLLILWEPYHAEAANNHPHHVFSKDVYWTDSSGGGKIYKLKSGEYYPEVLLDQAGFASGIAVSEEHGYLFWTTRHEIHRCNLQGTDKTTIYSGGSDAFGIVVHPTLEKIFWTDASHDKIYVADFNGNQVQVHYDLPGNNATEGLTLDLESNMLYWAGHTSGVIQRARAEINDAIPIETLHTANGLGPKGVAVDREAGKVYWAQYRQGKIMRMDLDGSNVETVQSSLNMPIAVSVFPEEGFLMWVEQGSGEIMLVSLDDPNGVPGVLFSGSGEYMGLAVNATDAELSGSSISINSDPAFDGIFPHQRVIHSLLELADQSVLVAGRTFEGVNLQRVYPNGTIDENFPFGGGVPSEPFNGDPEVLDMALLPDGRIVVVGNFTEWNDQESSGIVILHPNGQIAKTFSGVTGADAPIRTVLITGEGEILLGGDFTSFNEENSACLVKLSSVFSVQKSYDVVGDSVSDLQMTSRNNVYVQGDFFSIDNVSTYYIARLTGSNNRVDSTFQLLWPLYPISIAIMQNEHLYVLTFSEILKVDASGTVYEDYFTGYLSDQDVHILGECSIFADERNNLIILGAVYHFDYRGMIRIKPNGKVDYSLGLVEFDFDPYSFDGSLSGWQSDTGNFYLAGDFSVEYDEPTFRSHIYNFVKFLSETNEYSDALQLSSQNILESPDGELDILQFSMNTHDDPSPFTYVLPRYNEVNFDYQNEYFSIREGTYLQAGRSFDYEYDEPYYKLMLHVYADNTHILSKEINLELINSLNDDDDLDGLTEAEEIAAGTGAQLRDSDGDGALDGIEVFRNSNSMQADSRPLNYVNSWEISKPQPHEIPSDLPDALRVFAGTLSAGALLENGEFQWWGEDPYSIPQRLMGVVDVDLDERLVLFRDGTAQSYSSDSDLDVPDNMAPIVAIAAGRQHRIGLHPDGTITMWGNNREDPYGVYVIPEEVQGRVVAIAAAEDNSYVVLDDGTAVTWGRDANITEINHLSGIIDVTAGEYHSATVAFLHRDQSVTVTGPDPDKIIDIPQIESGYVNKIATDALGILTLSDSGRVAAYGKTFYSNKEENYGSIGPATVPNVYDNVVDIASGSHGQFALHASDWKLPHTTSNPVYHLTVGKAVQFTLPVEGFEVTEFSSIGLPEGLTLDPLSGKISGTPTQAGETTCRLIMKCAVTNSHEMLFFKITDTLFDTNNDGFSDLWELNHGYVPGVHDMRIQDSDKDGDLDILEIFQGTGRNNSGEHHGFKEVTSTGAVLNTRFRRSNNQTAVEATGQWSIDLVNWHHSGDSAGGVTVTFSERLIESHSDYEIVELTSTIDSGTSPCLFFRMTVTPKE